MTARQRAAIHTTMFLFISPEEYQNSMLEIGGQRYHHLVRVSRVRAGDVLRAALPDGSVVRATVSEITPHLLRAQVVGEEPPTGLSPCAITLYQAVLKGDKMDLVVQKATELGAHALAPLLAQRSIPRWTPAQGRERSERWQRIAESASEQCERSLPMRVHAPITLRDALDRDAIMLLLHEREGRPLCEIAAAHPQLARVGLYLGPEGGWEDDEVAQLLTAGAVPVHLGTRVLRAETAAIAAITLVQHLWGDLR